MNQNQLHGVGLVKVIYDNGYCFEEYQAPTPGGGGLDILRFTPSVNEFSATHYDDTGALVTAPNLTLEILDAFIINSHAVIKPFHIEFKIVDSNDPKLFPFFYRAQLYFPAPVPFSSTIYGDGMKFTRGNDGTISHAVAESTGSEMSSFIGRTMIVETKPSFGIELAERFGNIAGYFIV